MESHFVFLMEFFESRNLKPNEVVLNSPFREPTSAVLGKLLMNARLSTFLLIFERFITSGL